MKIRGFFIIFKIKQKNNKTNYEQCVALNKF